MRSPFRRGSGKDPVVVERIRTVEIPVLTEVKRLLGRADPEGAIRYAYPQLLRDLSRGYHVTFPPGYTHSDIVARAFTPEMRPLAEFFDRLYRLYAPVRYGHRAPVGASQELVELLHSLYSPEPMWHLYLRPAPGSGAPAPRGRAPRGGEGAP